MKQSLLTISQVAQILNIHPDTLRRWEKKGKIKPLRFVPGGHRRYRSADILEIIKKRTDEETASSATLNKIYLKLRKRSKEEVLSKVNKAQAIFFDVGHTLISLFPSREDIYAQISFEHGFEIDTGEIRLHFNRMSQEHQKEINRRKVFDVNARQIEETWTARNGEILRRAGVPKSSAMMIGNKIFHEIWGKAYLWRKYSFVDEVLERLKRQGKVLGVIDNWDKRLLGILKELGLRQYFDVVILGGEIGIWKPDSRLFKMALSRVRKRAREALFVGNNYTTDFLGASRMGIMPLLFDSKRHFREKKIPKFYKYEELL